MLYLKALRSLDVAVEIVQVERAHTVHRLAGERREVQPLAACIERECVEVDLPPPQAVGRTLCGHCAG